MPAAGKITDFVAYLSAVNIMAKDYTGSFTRE